MKAITVHRFGGPEVLGLEQRTDPVPGPGEVLIRVGAVAVNFVDSVVIAGRYQFLPALPFTPGKGPAGTVVALGTGVSGLAVGDRVLAMAEIGGYAELALAPAEQCYRLPDGMSFTDAAAMSLAFDTAWFALHERGRLAVGETVLVLGATGAVGFAAMQLAKAAGARVLAGVSSMDKAGLVREGGADAVIDHGVAGLRDALRDQVHAATEGRGADVVIDMLGGDIFDAAIRAVAWRGRVVVVGFAAGRIPTVKVNYLMVKNIEVSGLQISDYRKRSPALVRHCFEEIFALYQAGRIRAPAARCFPLAEAGPAMEALLGREVRDRILLVPAARDA
jgi:NADPH2:quinone reductase